MTAEADLVRSLRFANLTPPILRQMRDSAHAWRSLVDMARNAGNSSGRGTLWMPQADAGCIELRLSKGYEVRAAIKFWSAPNTMGPDQMRNRKLDVSRVRLPEILLAACSGRRVDEIVDGARFHGTFRHECVKRAEHASWGIILHLDMPYVQPTEEDLDQMLEMSRVILKQENGHGRDDRV